MLSKKDRWQLLIVIFAIAASIGACAAAFLLTIEDAYEIPIHFEVRPSVRNSTLYFEGIPPGRTGVRELLLRNSGEHPALMRIMLNGPYAEWLEPSKQLVYIGPATSTALMLRINVPAEAPYGNYTTAVDVIIHRLW
jgi:hypothetical protein